MSGRDTFFRYISPHHLYEAALVFAVMTVILVAMIFLFLYQKKRRYRVTNRLSELLNDWISESLIREDEAEHIELPTAILPYLKKEHFRQFIVDRLIIIKKNLSGKSRQDVVELYEKLGLKKDSISKMNSLVWHQKAKGIYELYMMNQSNEFPDIAKYTNNRNKYVHREAQTASIGFLGFAGLSFLNDLTQPLLDWQQIRLLEQLQSFNSTDMPDLPLWLQSENKYVVYFALKLADIYQQYQVHDIVALCMKEDSEKIRYRAINTLGRIATDETASILKAQYDTETNANKRAILVQISEIGSGADSDFLLDKLDETEDILKLEAGRALVKVSNDGWNILESKKQGNEVLESIVQQIKYEAA